MVFVAIVSVVHFSKVSAAPVIGFNAGNIMDDLVFTNTSTMNVAQIQAFLNSKVPVCDTYGTQPSEYGGGTRAQWGAARYGQTVFTCLKDYSEGGKTSAQIIYDAAQEFQINPQVIIVLLQKEQALITDTWPLDIQYRSATGYGCPDTAACDSQYYGLTNQVRWAARMFRAILNASPTWYTPYVLGNNYVRWSPNSSCGGAIINIENRTTQALYNYTPYQPNISSLNAGYGTGDACSAYGNRNFYLYFTDWFGSTRSNDTLNAHPDGTLVSIDGRIYLVQGSSLHYIKNATVFESLSYRWGDVKAATTGDKRLSVSSGIDTIYSGTLFATPGGSVYIMVSEGGSWVKQQMSYSSFVNLGYKTSQVRIIPSSDLPAETSPNIYFSDRHPDGTLIKNAQGIFIIEHSIKRYISPSVFESYRWQWSDVVNETSEDALLPIGPNMTLREGTVVADGSNLYIIDISDTGDMTKRPVGPWHCYSNVFKYNTFEIVVLNPQSASLSIGPIVTC